MSIWRLIVDNALSGPLNMAIDQAILESVGARQEYPTLRLYRWKPACLSLGYNQPYQDVDAVCIDAEGYQLVRRVTGGKAILHIDELTYSVAVPKDSPFAAGSIVESYKRLSKALMRGLELIGTSVQSLPKNDALSGDTGPVCFEVPSDYEITAAGKKLIGSAQVRRGQGVLQHGSLPLHGDIGRIADVLRFPDETARAHARQRIDERATTLENVLGVAPTWNDVAQAVIQGFTETFVLDFELQMLTTRERERASELESDVYSTEAWIQRR